MKDFAQDTLDLVDADGRIGLARTIELRLRRALFATTLFATALIGVATALAGILAAFATVVATRAVIGRT
ncbi:hypothetical protein D3C85_579600 [compost metagenome]